MTESRRPRAGDREHGFPVLAFILGAVLVCIFYCLPSLSLPVPSVSLGEMHLNLPRTILCSCVLGNIG